MHTTIGIKIIVLQTTTVQLRNVAYPCVPTNAANYHACTY